MENYDKAQKNYLEDILYEVALVISVENNLNINRTS